MDSRSFVHFEWLLAYLLAASALAAQRGPVPDPLVRENATVKLAEHTYVIPDNNVPLVPNVGVVVDILFAAELKGQGRSSDDTADGAAGVPGRAPGLAPRQRPGGRGPRRIRGNAVTETRDWKLLVNVRSVRL